MMNRPQTLQPKTLRIIPHTLRNQFMCFWPQAGDAAYGAGFDVPEGYEVWFALDCCEEFGGGDEVELTGEDREFEDGEGVAGA